MRACTVNLDHVGICEECGDIQDFANEQSRDGWLKFHPHEWSYADES